MTVRDKNKKTIGILLLNLGGPDSLKAVKPFLYNLFSDREIIRLGPSFLQKPFAWLISSIRSKETKKFYSLIGGKSPIFDITAAQAVALEKALNAEVKKMGSSEDKNLSTSQPLNFSASQLCYKVYIGMRYWHPFIKDTVENIIKEGIKYLVVLSLYPHYSRATTGSAIAEFKRSIAKAYPPTHPFPSRGEGKGGGGMMVKYIEQWYDFPLYVDSLAELIFNGISEFKENNVEILFSAHGLPLSFIEDGDPYVNHINTTIIEVCKRLSDSPYNIKSIKWHLSFQSRSGPVKWLQPATNETIIKLAKEGVKNLLIVPISFVSDHIETLYEIDILYKELAGRLGINFKRCQSLNTSGKFIKALRELVVLKIRETG